MDRLLPGHLDYIFFCYGLAMFLLAGACVIIGRSPKGRLSWHWLGAFGLLHGVREWLDLASMSIPFGPGFATFRLAMLALALMCLLKFGLDGLEIRYGKTWFQWLYVPLLTFTLFGGLAGGAAGLIAALRYGLGLIGGLTAGWAFWLASRREPVAGRPLRFAAWATAGFGLSLCVVPPANYFPASILNHTTFLLAAGYPVELLRGVLAILITLSIWRYYQVNYDAELEIELGCAVKNRRSYQMVAAILFVLIAGDALTEIALHYWERAFQEKITAFAETAAKAINPRRLQQLTGTPADRDTPDYVRLREQLNLIKPYCGRGCDVHLIIQRGGRFLHAIDVVPEGMPPHHPGIDPSSQAIRETYQTGATSTVRLIGSSRNDILGVAVALADPSAGKIEGVLKLTLDAAVWRRQLAQYRMIPIACVMAASLATIFFFVSRRRAWEHAQLARVDAQRLADAQRVARLGSWTFDVRRRQATWSEEMYRICGLDSQSVNPSDAPFFRRVAAGDRERFQEAVRKAIRHGAECEIEFCVVRPDGQQRMVVASARVKRDRRGRVLRWFGTLQDVTENRKTMAELRKLHVAVEQSPAVIVITDREGRIEYANPKFTELTGYTLEEARGQTPRILKSGMTPPEDYVNLWQTILSGRQWRGEFFNRKKNGDFYWERAVIAPVVEPDGTIVNLIAIKEDITDFKLAEEQLAVARREAEEAAQAKSTFLATMSHEIRTPLNAVLGMASLLMDTKLDDEQRDCCDTIRVSGETLLSLINDILDYSKIDAGKLELECRPFNPRQCIREAVGQIATRAKEKGLIVNRHVDAGLPERFLGDAVRLRQILLNLLTNAVKFTQEGYIHISLSGSSTHGSFYELHFSVRDTGSGIPLDRQDRLFQSFSQVDASTSRRFGGTGLGLAISRRLCEAMAGKIWVESSGVPGEGATFHFTVQLPKTSEPIEEPVVQATTEIELDASARPRVLLAEDNPINQKVMLRMLDKLHCDADVANNGAEAIEATKRRRYDLVLMDCQMPEVDGYEAARRIRFEESRENRQPLYIVALTANAMQGDRELCLAAGMDDYLSKPVRPEELEQALRRRPVRAKEPAKET